jgi:hypothetical protein
MKYIKWIIASVLLPIFITVVGTLITTQLENVDIFTGFISFLEKFKKVIMNIFCYKISIWIIVLFLLILIIVFKIFRNNKMKSNKPNMKWFKGLRGKNFPSYQFLLWYPLNGLHTAKLTPSDPNLRIQIRKSPIIKGLLDHKIIQSDLYGYSFDICDEAYDFLALLLREQFNPNDEILKENLRFIKETHFPHLIASYIFESAIEID